MANRFTNLLSQIQNHAVAAAFVLIAVMLIIPFPAPMIDLMMIVNVLIGFIVLLTVIYTPKTTDLSSFPRVIVSITIYGLALNVRSTYFILSNGHVGIAKFGAEMIKAFARIVAGGNLVLGIVVFVLLILFQVMVLNKGTTRVTEVAARFALDSMNSKMFAIDGELNSGDITVEQARERKAAIMKESDFFSNMDGSSKFVSGSVKLGIVITCINLFAGVGIAMFKFDMSWSNAMDTFPLLTIGDGLLSQVPAMLLSLATGLLVTGSSSTEVLGDQLKKEFSISENVYYISGTVLCFIGVVFFAIGGSLSLFILLALVGGLTIMFGVRLKKGAKVKELKKAEAEAKASNKGQSGQSPAQISPVVPLDTLCLELGVALLPLVNKDDGGELLERITRIRREAALDIGLVVPSIRIIDNLTLDPQEYCFKIRGVEAGRSKLKMGYYMCINAGGVIEEMKGEATVDPTFGVPAIWLPADQRREAESNGYNVIDAPTIIATHITEILRSKAADIVSREEVSAIINKIKETSPVVVGEVIDTYKYTYGEIQKIFQGLLRERVSIRDIVTILETLANYGMFQHDPYMLIEKVREALGKQICLQYIDPDDPGKKLSVIQLSQTWAQKILDSAIYPKNGGEPMVGFDGVEGRHWIQSVSGSIAALRDRNIIPIILCPTPEVRQLVAFSISRELPGTVVISLNEVIAAGSDINVEILGEISE